MQIEWLSKLSYQEIKDFVDYLKNLHPDYDSLWPSEKRERDRIQNVYIPILNNEGKIPENMKFAELIETFDCNKYTISHEIHSYYKRMSVYKLNTITSTHYVNIMTTKEASDYTNVPKEKLRRLAREGKIQALKQGNEWRFLSKILDGFLLRKDLE